MTLVFCVKGLICVSDQLLSVAPAWQIQLTCSDGFQGFITSPCSRFWCRKRNLSTLSDQLVRSLRSPNLYLGSNFSSESHIDMFHYFLGHSKWMFHEHLKYHMSTCLLLSFIISTSTLSIPTPDLPQINNEHNSTGNASQEIKDNDIFLTPWPTTQIPLVTHQHVPLIVSPQYSLTWSLSPSPLLPFTLTWPFAGTAGTS